MRVQEGYKYGTYITSAHRAGEPFFLYMPAKLIIWHHVKTPTKKYREKSFQITVYLLKQKCKCFYLNI